MVGFLETKVKEENMTQVVSKVCSNWQWVHNVDSNNRGRILVCGHPQRYQFQVIFKNDQVIHGRAIHLSTSNFFLNYIRVWEKP